MASRYRILMLCVGACLLAGAAPVPDKAPGTIPGWGKVTDPDGDCTTRGDKRKLTIKVPGGTHDLNVTHGGMQAPRVLRSVAGDFTAQVKVTCDLTPGDKPGKEGSASSFFGAGLLLWQDKDNYLRLERNAWWVADAGRYASYPPLVEYFKDGEYQNTDPLGTLDEVFKGRSTWLRLERKGDTVLASYSHDGKQWSEARTVDVNLPKKVQIGVDAVNTSAKDFEVEFTEFKVSTK
jgi:hypothetical protein